jgi:hypothetical protein
MNFANTSSPAVLLPVCAAIEGREVTCPAAMQHGRPTPAALRRMTTPVFALPAH